MCSGPPRIAGPLLLLLAVSSCASPSRTQVPALVFRNTFWVNLHHFVRAEARRTAHGADAVLALDDLTGEERVAWRAALDAYGGIAERNLLFDEELVRINVALAGMTDEDALPGDLFDPVLVRAVNGAAPIYRERLWPEQERRNDAWIARTRKSVEPHWPALAAALARSLRCAWPTDPILVDVTAETGRNLAYTTTSAPRGFSGLVTILPARELDGPAAAECLVHEALHVVDHVLVRWIEEESARQGLAPPPELWHALLTFTAGVVSARELGAEGTYRADLARDWPGYAGALERHWRAYLEDESLFDQALHGLVRDAAARR